MRIDLLQLYLESQYNTPFQLVLVDLFFLVGSYSF